MKTKTVFKYFSILDHEKEQDYLRAMHQQGWKFTGVSGLSLFHFEECVPADVIYQLDYNKEGLAHKEEYVQMFRDCGWEYLQDYVGYSYFRKPAQQAGEEDDAIFCDDESRLQMMTRVFRGRVLPLVFLFTVLLVPQFVLQLVFDHNTALIISHGVIIVLYLLIFAGFAVKYQGYRNKVRR